MTFWRKVVLGGAARSYWAALDLVGPSFASRMERRENSQSCSMTAWPAWRRNGTNPSGGNAHVLFVLDQQVIFTSLRQAQADSRRFRAEMSKVKEAAVAGEQAEAAANNAALVNALTAGLAQLQAQTYASAGNQNSALQAESEELQNLIGFNEEQAERFRTIRGREH